MMVLVPGCVIKDKYIRYLGAFTQQVSFNSFAIIL